MVPSKGKLYFQGSGQSGQPRVQFEGEFVGTSYRVGREYYRDGTISSEGIFRHDQHRSGKRYFPHGTMLGVAVGGRVAAVGDFEGYVSGSGFSAFSGLVKGSRYLGVGAALSDEGTFRNGELVQGTRYNRHTGHIEAEGSFDKGKLTGFGKTFCSYEPGVGGDDGDAPFQPGRVKEEGEFFDGKLHGEGKQYDYNGALRAHGNFIGGDLHGPGRTYWSDGHLATQGTHEGTFNLVRGEARRQEGTVMTMQM
mmetsp:Transcript_8523/g.25305  ORF Transcript_8523/g.25305 Transcript_8523/m.25305 type:complete len:251 (-) Transcript_8523:74-826(-)